RTVVADDEPPVRGGLPADTLDRAAKVIVPLVEGNRDGQRLGARFRHRFCSTGLSPGPRVGVGAHNPGEFRGRRLHSPQPLRGRLAPCAASPRSPCWPPPCPPGPSSSTTTPTRSSPRPSPTEP